MESEGMRGKRGLTVKETLGGTLTRFFPASFLSVGALLAISGVGVVYEFLLIVLFFSGLITLGFGVGLEGLRRWLYPEANVRGRRTVLAGVLSPLAWGLGILLAQSLEDIIRLDDFLYMGFLGLVGTLVGVVLALGMFFPWLTRTMNTGFVDEDAPPDSG